MPEAVLRPPALRAGDTVALVAPSRPSDPRRLEAAAGWLRRRGYRVQAAGGVHARYHYLAGRDADRAAAVMDAFADDGVAALLCVRGGFGTGRMVDRLDYDTIAAHPKPLLGFSDSTGLQLAIHARTGLVTFTGVLADSDLGRPRVDPLVADSFDRLLTRREPFGAVPDAGDGLRTVRPGHAEGPLLAANLSLLCSLLGTPYAPALDGVVLVVEDVGEAPYRVDRMLTQLRLAGSLDRLAALVLGTFQDCFVPTEMADSPTLEELVEDVVGDRPFPVLAGLAYGHTPRKSILPNGVRVRVDAEAPSLTILEAAVD